MKILVLFDDLLRGSNALGTLRAAGHEAQLAAVPPAGPVTADVAVLDAGAAFDAPLACRALVQEGVPVLAVYSHVDTAQRDAILAAGATLAVPRSRFAREGAALVERAATSPR